ncbi:MAG: hypothetical protein LBQ22_07095 [Bacteroidales bacterium]|jgi:hypothetical protein|nr:hypothetical protein [Bacteroidales bacterium]
METRPHIGKLIEKEAKRLRITHTEFARQLNRDRTIINHIFNQPSIDMYRLLDISDILKYDFIGNCLCNSCASRGKIEIIKTIDLSQEKINIIEEDKKRILFEIKL